MDKVKYLRECKEVDYIITIPLSDFESVKELGDFIEDAKKMGIVCNINCEYSNFYQGILIEIQNKEGK